MTGMESSFPASPRAARATVSTHRTAFVPTEPDVSSLNDCDPGSYSLSSALYSRRADFTRRHRIRIKIGTWNVASCPGTDKDLASWFIEGKGVDSSLANASILRNSTTSPASSSEVRLLGGDQIGLYVLGLQEIVDLNVARSSIFSDASTIDKWRAALSDALPKGYQLLVSEQLSGLLLLIYASPEVAKMVDNVSNVTVGTGLLGYMGNKGAVATRFLLGETSRLVFINCHLASGIEASYLDRRCWDYQQILSRVQFAPIRRAGLAEEDVEKIGDEDFAFWFGDLNFRLDGIPSQDLRHILSLHARGEYDVENASNALLDDDDAGVFVNASDSDDDDGTEGFSSVKTAEIAAATTTTTTISTQNTTSVSRGLSDGYTSHTRSGDVNRKGSIGSQYFDTTGLEDYRPDPAQNPASLQATLDSILPHDQLRRVIKERKAFHEGWREGPISFLPTYKYNVGTVGLFDSGSKQRAPSWCDRILYRTRRGKEQYDQKVADEQAARKKDEDMKARGIDMAGEDDEVLFAYDPDNDGDSFSRRPSQQDYEHPRDATAPAEDLNNKTCEDGVSKDVYHDQIQLDVYTSHQRITSSDHKPLVSIFTIDFDAVVPELRTKIYAEVARELDRMENEGRPSITIVIDGQSDSSAEGVDFGEIGFLRKVTRTLTIANTGRVPAIFAFVEKPTTGEEDAQCAPWLSTRFTHPLGGELPQDGIELLGKEMKIEPGDTLTAVLDAYVSSSSQVSALNSGTIKIEDVLVLRVNHGRDYFIPVRGTWLPTCFGRSIDELIRLPSHGGIREFAKLHPHIASCAIPYSLEVHTSHPRELFGLIEAVERLAERVVADEMSLANGTNKARSFTPGWPFDPATWIGPDTSLSGEVASNTRSLLVTALDHGQSLLNVFPRNMPSSIRLELTCSVLRKFLLSLTDGIITPSLWARIETTLPTLNTAYRTDEEVENDKTHILDILSTAPNHNISFVFLMAMLDKVVKEISPFNKGMTRSLSQFGRPASLVLRSKSKSGRPPSGLSTGTNIDHGGDNVECDLSTSNGSTSERSATTKNFRQSYGWGGNVGDPRMETALPNKELDFIVVAQRRAMQQAVAKVVGEWICRSHRPLVAMSAKERKTADEKKCRLVELFFLRT